MTTEELHLEKVANDIAVVACEDIAFLTSGDPWRRVDSHIEAMEHGHVVRVAVLLFQRFRCTAADRMPSMDTLVAAVDHFALPALLRLGSCIAGRRAFQSAFSLGPLLSRTVGAAAQCCGLAVRNITCAAALMTITRLIELYMKVIVESIVERVECFRPIDSGRLSFAHQEFDNLQASFARALSHDGIGNVEKVVGASDVRCLTGATPLMAGSACAADHGHGTVAATLALEDAETSRPRQVVLAPPPGRPQHSWRNEELRQFWEARCTPRYGDRVPVDALAMLLLRATSLEVSLANREAVMRHLTAIPGRKETGVVALTELDRCGPEVRRSGGLRAWVNVLLLPGGPAAAGPGPYAAGRLSSSRGPPGSAATAACRASSTAAATATTASGNSTWPPLSARTMGSSTAFTPRGWDMKKPFALSSTTSSWRRPVAGEENGDRAHSTGAPALNASVERGSLKATQQLLLGSRHCVNPRHTTWRETPLHAAAMQDTGHAPISTLLLERGADANAEDKHLATPLHVAASAGQTEVARKLVRCGADVCKEDRWRTTPLHKAALNGQVEVADVLLQGGAGTSAVDAWGATPLHHAAARGQLVIAEKLLSGGAVGIDLDAEDTAGQRPLHIAARNGDYAFVRLLLEHGASATARNRCAGKTAEDCARERGHIAVVNLLQHREEWVTPQLRATALVTAR
eukprot:TRINITY_DN41711_c0_g1_i1.p1 TRINITY_DN41711_c0_g1~~TRINITY_DN41711_c0_g1_i1.p1  ORF type:complete len:721 (+),score=119.25 TRINITY_DN41711_c0_g1_i1:96-2165(+)